MSDPFRADVRKAASVAVGGGAGCADCTAVVHQPVAKVVTLLGWHDFSEGQLDLVGILFVLHKTDAV